MIITVYSYIFRYIQQYSTMFRPIFRHIRACWGTLRHIEAYSDIIVAYWAIFRTLGNLCIYNRLVFSQLFDFCGNLGNVKQNRLEKLVSPVKWSAWLYPSTLQNFATRHFFDVNEVSIVFSIERDFKTGETN